MDGLRSNNEDDEDFDVFWDGSPILHQLLKNLETGIPVNWDDVLERMDRFRDEVKWEDPNDGLRFLHEALYCYDYSRSMPEEVVVKALDIYPEFNALRLSPTRSVFIRCFEL